ncbi:hypothetical protein [Rhizobium sp. Leaf453]|uniref:hypothetical protein n=1 Tax=Rhizobium sp. Leaf453 TaxID=1736380 RepID=UPI0007142B31|nr:hypothetical protein [Rhizobium sp. Leaf453]KQT96982.1 hypothetical protein ASG68_08475 [Rhizobium sp. Leaf453]
MANRFASILREQASHWSEQVERYRPSQTNLPSKVSAAQSLRTEKLAEIAHVRGTIEGGTVTDPIAIGILTAAVTELEAEVDALVAEIAKLSSWFEVVNRNIEVWEQGVERLLNLATELEA